MAKKVPCTNEDKQKSFYKFYAQDIYAGEQENMTASRKNLWIRKML